MRALDVWLHDRRAGRLEQSDGALRFAYDDDYLAAGGPPLSQSLPLGGGPFDQAATHSFFSNLLPEGDVRRVVARWLGVSPENDFGLLAGIGGDCAGAVSLMAPGIEPKRGEADAVEWLDERALVAAIEDLPRRPLLANPDEGIRLSLAGAQDKLPVVVDGDRIGVPHGNTPSTHILKTPIDRFEDTVENEAFSLRLARALGLRAANATVGRVGEHRYLLVERYDRAEGASGAVRLHQEDFCQALGTPPELKYQSEGGPSLADCFGLVREATSVPAQDLIDLMEAVTFNFLLGNHDAHGKNFSLLYEPQATRLAPLYDLVSTVVYPGLTRKMAMKLGGEYRPDYVRRRHVDRFAADAGLGAAAVRRRMLLRAQAAPDVAADVARRTAPAERRPVIERIVQVVAARAKLLQDELGDAID
jgi:serine/threonine-protein kinase HipA